MTRALAVIAAILLAIFMSSCVLNSPDKILENLQKTKIRLDTGLKTGVLTGSFDLSELLQDFEGGFSGQSVTVSLPSFNNLSGAQVNTGELVNSIEVLSGATGEVLVNQSVQLDLTGSGASSVVVELPILLGVSVEDDGGKTLNDFVITAATITINDSKGKNVEFSIDDYERNPIVLRIIRGENDSNAVSIEGPMTVTITSVELRNVTGHDATITSATITITPVDIDKNVDQVYYDGNASGTTNIFVESGKVYKINSIDMSGQDLNIDFPQDLKDKGISAVEFPADSQNIVSIHSDDMAFTEANGTFTPENGDLVYHLQGRWDSSEPLPLSLSTVTVYFEEGRDLQNLGVDLSLNTEVQLSKVTFDFSNEATVFEFSPDPLKFDLPEGQEIKAATFTIEGTNTTGFTPTLLVYVNGEKRSEFALSNNFEGSFSLKEGDFDFLKSESGLPVKLVVAASGEQTIDFSNPGKIDYVVKVDVDVSVQFSGGDEE